MRDTRIGCSRRTHILDCDDRRYDSQIERAPRTQELLCDCDTPRLVYHVCPCGRRGCLYLSIDPRLYTHPWRSHVPRSHGSDDLLPDKCLERKSSCRKVGERRKLRKSISTLTCTSVRVTHRGDQIHLYRGCSISEIEYLSRKSGKIRSNI